MPPDGYKPRSSRAPFVPEPLIGQDDPMIRSATIRALFQAWPTVKDDFQKRDALLAKYDAFTGQR
jgi:hypothetical protein